jgi:hypothetical protein
MKVTRTDIATVIAKGTLGAIPLVGALAAEVVGALIPNRRVDRIETLLQELSLKLGNREPETVRDRFTSPEFSDILEEGLTQSARALSDERIKHIASLLKNSLTEAELTHVQDKRMLELLGQVNDAELIMLQSYTRAMQYDQAWREKHDAVLHSRPAYIGAAQDDLDQATLQQQFREHLAQLGLLTRRVKSWKKGELPEFDEKTGLPKSSGYEITALGRLLLRRIDVLGADQY